MRLGEEYKRSGLLLTACLFAGVLSASDTFQPAVIQLLSHAEVTGECVRLSDVAEISASAPDVRRRLAEIDLVAVEGGRPQQRIPRELIELRLRLAGFDTRDIEFTGTHEVVVTGTPVSDLTDAGLEGIAAETFAAQLGIGADDLRVTTTTPCVERWRAQGALPVGVRLEIVPTSEVLLGRVNCTCRLLEGRRLILSHAATFHVARRHTVLVAAASLSRGQTLAAGLVREEIRYLSTPADELALGQVEGKPLKMSLVPGEVVTLRHVAVEAGEEGPIVIRPRDAVRLTARKGSLQVVIRDAEALQSGRTGQLIRVKNVQSNRIVTGRVVGPGEVEIQLR
jgi:flagella basal body P-ring formation protein FlgA